ncbi:glycosyltransferase family 2 protein [Bacteroides hominis]|uniref:glycosyltransferase family 2 protein n=1 Tax=Bacteroides hominis TaxID=2763023 RepID=UPI003D6C3132
MQNLKISLITTSYNSETTISDTLSSVLFQSYSNIEYIIVDGGSSDETISIIKEYEPLFNGRLKWVSEKDDGIYDAMNKGIQMASGDIVGILNSDDFFTSDNVLAAIITEFDRYSLDAVYGDVHFVRSNNLHKSIRYYSSKIFKPKLMRLGFMPAHPSFYCWKDCFLKYGFYKIDYSICADFELLLRFIYVHKIVTKYIPMDMVTMRVGGVSTNGLKSHIKILREHLRAFKENGIRANLFLLAIRYFYKVTEFIK